MSKNEILLFLSTHKKELSKRFGLKSIGLFGSYARGEETPSSDIDLAIELESNNSFRSFFGLKYYLEENLQTTIDLGIESTLKPIVKESIQNEIIYV